jgi:hypothetical protein
MNKKQIINQFTKAIITEEQRKNKVTAQQITSTLITTSLELAFVNETCKSTGQVSKSQVIYRKLEGKSKEEIKECFRLNTIRFLKILNIFRRNRKFVISFDTTKEAFYGDYLKAEDKIYLHNGQIAKESEYYYEYLTSAITSNGTEKYILDGVMVPRGYYVEDYVKRYKKRWAIETIYRVTDKIRAYTTSTKSIIRYFLFMFTCFVYNIWRFLQMFLGEEFTLSNFKVNMVIFMAKYGRIYPVHYNSFEEIASKLL